MNTDMPTKVMRLEDIIPAEYNPRQDLQKGDFEYDRLKDSIDTLGFVKPLVVNIRNNVLVSGHQRLKILLENGVTETEVMIVDLDDEKEKLLNIAMNRIEGDWEWSKLESLLKEFSADELSVTGFTLAEIESIFEMNAEDAGSIYAPGVVEDDTDAEDYFEEDADYEGEETLDDDAASPMDNTPCTVYLSFSDKEAAENWLASQGIDRKFDRSQNIIVRMEGTEYGTASN